MSRTRNSFHGVVADDNGQHAHPLRLPAQCMLAHGPDLASIQPAVESLHARFTWDMRAGERHHRASCPAYVAAAKYGPLALSTIAYGGCYDIHPEHLAQAVLATTVLDGRMAQRTRAHDCAAHAGETVLAADVDCPSYGYEDRTEVLKLRLPQVRIDALCWQLLGHAGAASVHFAQAALTGHAANGWLSLLQYLMQSVRGQVDGCAPWMGQRLEECFVLHLLQTMPHNYSEALRREASAAHVPSPRAHQRARAYIEAHWQEGLTLAELAQAVGCSIRSLTRTFQRAENATPMQFLQELRLQRVRTALVARAAQETVAAVAMRCGFGHLGEFNRQYRRRFGESPSETRARQG